MNNPDPHRPSSSACTTHARRAESDVLVLAELAAQITSWRYDSSDGVLEPYLHLHPETD
jgi:hypothetical protein